MTAHSVKKTWRDGVIGNLAYIWYFLASNPGPGIHTDGDPFHIYVRSAFSLEVNFALGFSAYLLQIPAVFSDASHLIFFDLHLIHDVFGKFLPGNCLRVRFCFGSDSSRGSSGDSVGDASFSSLDPSFCEARLFSFGISAKEL